MLNKFDIRVVATDGTYVKKILWVKSTKKHISYGFDVHGEGGHYTYHKDGKVHYKSKQIEEKINAKIPLEGFKGGIQVGNVGSIKDLEQLPHVDFDYKKVDGLVYVDFRTLNPKNNTFNIDLQFVEENRMDLIYYFPNRKSIHIFTLTNPWVVIQIG